MADWHYRKMAQETNKMADRTYNSLDTDIYAKPWPKCARRIWAHICIIQPNQYGIFDSQLGVVYDFWDDVYDAVEIDEAVSFLVKLGVLKTYSNDAVWWVVKKWKRESSYCNTARQYKGLENHLNKFPEVKRDFLKQYPNAVSKPLTNGVGNAVTDDVGNAVANTDSDTDSDKEVSTSEYRGTPAKAGKPSKPKPEAEYKQTDSYTEDDFNVAKKIITHAEQLRDEGYPIRNPRTPYTIAAAIAKCQVSHEQISQAFAWAVGEAYHRKSIGNLAQWSKPGSFDALWSKCKQQAEIHMGRGNRQGKLLSDQVSTEVELGGLK
jgi:hypothetical protein